MASTSSFRASSSSSTPSIPQTSTYDVFLSFRGEDTRYNFTDHLYKALVNRGIRTFRDDKLRRGEAIAPELLKAIEESRSSVIVFSENYARSRWCLDELVKIMECHKDLGHAVFPIFYHVDPSHVRKQEGSFGEAFAGYEENWKDKIPRWRTALTEAANLSGWHLVDGYESDNIKKITDDIFRQLNCKRLDVGDNLVGIDSRLKEMDLRLDMESNAVRIVGIYGIGGIGKTTIARVIYNNLSSKFECMSFLENIRGRGLPHLQNQLLASMIKSILPSKRAFIVLDDVDNLVQLEYLLGNRGWLGKGSKVIITTRNKHLLNVQGVDDLYEVKQLNFNEAYELFSLYAFKQNHPKSGFVNLSYNAVRYCQRLPLALKVLGSLLFSKTIPQWESELHKLERVPEAEIHNVLKRSYDGLDYEDRDSVLRILDGCNFHAERGIKNLIDKCLITLRYNRIHLHDLIQQMGWEIVRENFPNKPDKWSRLWDPHDIERALTTCEGIKGVETINLDLSKLKRVRFNSNVFSKMTSLRLLKVHSNVNLDQDFFYDSEEGRSWLYKLEGIHLNRNYDTLRLHKVHSNHDSEEDIMACKDYHDYEVEWAYDSVMKIASKMQLGLDFEIPSYELRYLCWDGYPLDSLPSNFDGENLVELHLKCSNIKQLWQENKVRYLESLKVIDLSYSKKLVQMPEFSSLSNLERLILNGCVSLIDIHPSVGDLKKLTTLNLRRCHKLKGLPSSISKLESLEFLDLSKCSSFCNWDLYPCGLSNLEKCLVNQRNMRSLRPLYLCKTAIRELPSSIDLESVEILDLSDCFEFEKFSENGAKMKSLWQLDLTNTAIKELPTGIANWESLPTLDLSKCSKFEKFPEIQGNMRTLETWNLLSLLISDCSKFEKFPEKGGNMKRLRNLSLKNTAIKDLPDSIGDLESLRWLDLSDCSKFEKFPEKGGNMKRLRNLSLKNTAIKDLPDSIGDLESLWLLDLSDCSKFEKFPEKGGNMKSLGDLPTNISRLKNLKRLILGGCSDLQCKMAGQILVLPSSLQVIDAYHCTSKEDLSGLLWLCHLNWLKSTTEELKCWKLSAVIPESNGIPEWIRYQNMGSEVTTELPTNWYEDPDFLGFVVSCVYGHIPTSDFAAPYLECELNLHGNGFEFKDKCCHTCCCGVHGNFKDLRDQVWVWWYPKIAIPKEHHHKYTHINASFRVNWTEIKKCGINLIFAGDQQNHMPMLEHPQNSGDNGSALQDTVGNVHGANQQNHIPMLLDLPGNFGDIGSVILEGTDGNRKRRRDDSIPDVVEEPHYKRLGAPNTDPLL
ncbi:hypothetical protein AAG906_003396 [Vitis piasezkii]